MLKETKLAMAILGALLLTATGAVASRAAASQGERAAHHRRVYDLGYRKGYSAGYRQGYAQGSDVRSANAVAPGASLGAAVLGATFGYWSDGTRVYGGDPCYIYNDRDWAWDKVC